MRRIALDAMGGDHAPGPELDAAIHAVKESRGTLGVILVGDAERLRGELAARDSLHALQEGGGLEVRHASQSITMDDSPSAAVRTKKDSSMRVAFDLVKRGDAAAVVSAGNSGAMLACGMLVMKRLPGAIRPGIVTTFPTVKGSCALCDMGANVDVKPAGLAQFGLLASVFAQVEHGKRKPRLGVLSNGEEESKGTDLTREAHRILRKLAAHDAPFDYKGYVEGKDIFTGDVDVVATDGFTGNVVLKTSEGCATALIHLLKQAFKSSARAKVGGLLAAKALREFGKRIDWAETGGAPLLGVDGVAVICHGRSTSFALKNAIFAAARFAERELPRHLGASLLRHQSMWSAALGESREQEA
jgi:glycerol-3-phosphate acyltransferase PlsX